MKTTPENIERLEHNQIFVFGSNTAGVHGKGAARTAQILFGAQRGVSEGRTGKCYAIPTRIYLPRTPDNWKARFEPVTLVEISRSVKRFLDYADSNINLEFLVTKIGCGYAGYGVDDIRDIFHGWAVPGNVVLPIEFQ